MDALQNTVSINLVLDRLTTKEVLRAVLHAILFHRLFGNIKPRTVEVFDVTMPGVKDMEIEQLVNEKVDLFWKGMEGGTSKRGQIDVIFSEKKTRKTWFLGETQEDVPWERWTLNIESRQRPFEHDRREFEREISKTLTKALHTMLNHTSSEKGRSVVPPIQSQGLSPFPMQITVKVAGVEMS